MVKIEEQLDKKDGYAIFINDKEVFKIEKENTFSETLRECLTLPMLLQQVYEYGLNNQKIIFGIRNTEGIGKDI